MSVTVGVKTSLCLNAWQQHVLWCREPAKFVAKLREHKTDKRMLLFKCDLGAGHFSQSGRFDRLKDTAIEYAFLLKCQGIENN